MARIDWWTWGEALLALAYILSLYALTVTCMWALVELGWC